MKALCLQTIFVFILWLSFDWCLCAEWFQSQFFIRNCALFLLAFILDFLYAFRFWFFDLIFVYVVVVVIEIHVMIIFSYFVYFHLRPSEKCLAMRTPKHVHHLHFHFFFLLDCQIVTETIPYSMFAYNRPQSTSLHHVISIHWVDFISFHLLAKKMR